MSCSEGIYNVDGYDSPQDEDNGHEWLERDGGFCRAAMRGFDFDSCVPETVRASSKENWVWCEIVRLRVIIDRLQFIEDPSSIPKQMIRQLHSSINKAVGSLNNIMAYVESKKRPDDVCG